MNKRSASVNLIGNCAVNWHSNFTWSIKIREHEIFSGASTSVDDAGPMEKKTNDRDEPLRRVCGPGGPETSLRVTTVAGCDLRAGEPSRIGRRRSSGTPGERSSLMMSGSPRLPRLRLFLIFDSQKKSLPPRYRKLALRRSQHHAIITSKRRTKNTAHPCPSSSAFFTLSLLDHRVRFFFLFISRLIDYLS